MKQKNPQEKKQLSYAKDRRNTYGEAPHAARKAIPLRKAQRSRANRRLQNQILNVDTGVVELETAEMLESNLQHQPFNDWKKSPDSPLGEVIAKKLEDRETMRNHGGRSALVLSIRYEPPISEFDGEGQT